MMEKRSFPQLSVVIVNYNGKELLRSCLKSLHENMDDIPFEIIVVDNHSSDGSADMAAASFPGIHLIRMGENAGFSRANNAGIRIARGEFLLILNPDTLVPPWVMPVLWERLQADPGLGGVAPGLLLAPDRFQISFGGRVHFFTELWKKLFLNRRMQNRLKTRRSPREVHWLGGACMFLRAQAVKDVGGFDEHFFLFFEDIDLCLRLREKGWRLEYFPGVQIHHEGGASTAKIGLESRYHYRRSQLYFYSKHNSRWSLFLLRLYLRLTFTWQWLGGRMKTGGGRDEHRRFFALLKGR